MVTEGKEKLASSNLQTRSAGLEDWTQLHLRLHYTIAQILAAAGNEHEACAGILSTLCQNLDMPWSALWLRRGDELRLLGCWHNSACAAEEFDQISRACAFTKGEGLPGQVWSKQAPVWIPDFRADTQMPRRLVAARCNFRSAFGIPISSQDFLGVIEFFTEQTLPADLELLKMVTATGAQIGQFLERKRAEQALAESQGLFQGVFQGARDAVLLTDGKGRCIEANIAALNLFGMQRDELLATNVSELIPIGPKNTAKDRWKEILESPGLESEFTFRRSNGGVIDLEYRVTPKVIPGVNLLVLRDMTGRKNRDRSIRILAAAGAILGEGLDFQATVDRVARVAIPEFADWCVLDLLGADSKIERVAIAHADPEIEAEVREHARAVSIDPSRKFGSPNVIRTGQTELIEVTPEILRKTAGDQYIDLAQRLNLEVAVITPLKRQGRTFGALSFWRTKARGPFSAGDAELADELARRVSWALENARLYETARQELQLREKAETELKQLNAELEKRIADRTAALKESHSQLESFCYSVSHDLRAPLRSMQGFSHALLEDHSAELSSEGQDFARRILSASEHMDSLLVDVLTYSRLSRQELRFEPVDIDSVVEGAHAQLLETIRKRAADVKIISCSHKAVANRSVLELMTVNLLDNALKFVPANRAPRITIDCERRSDTIRIWVRDNGIGIAREHQQKIFRIFERLHGVEEYPGTGIGLALVHKAAERMNGSAGVESTLGEGSAFWIELPVAI